VILDLYHPLKFHRGINASDIKASKYGTSYHSIIDALVLSKTYFWLAAAGSSCDAMRLG
jgi:hypothetical protein